VAGSCCQQGGCASAAREPSSQPLARSRTRLCSRVGKSASMVPDGSAVPGRTCGIAACKSNSRPATERVRPEGVRLVRQAAAGVVPHFRMFRTLRKNSGTCKSKGCRELAGGTSCRPSRRGAGGSGPAAVFGDQENCRPAKWGFPARKRRKRPLQDTVHLLYYSLRPFPGVRTGRVGEGGRLFFDN
jgi:hypothetical protein